MSLSLFRKLIKISFLVLDIFFYIKKLWEKVIRFFKNNFELDNNNYNKSDLIVNKMCM